MASAWVVFALVLLIAGILAVAGSSRKALVFGESRVAANAASDGKAAGVVRDARIPGGVEADRQIDPAKIEIDFSTPLRSQIGRLSRAADAGDFKAICSLVKSFDYCRSLDSMKTMQDVLYEEAVSIRENGSSEIDALVEDIRRSEDRIAKAAEFCEALGVSVNTELARRLLQAAEKGDLNAMNQFVFNPPLGGGSAFEESDAIIVFKKNAPAILERAALGGDMKAIVAIYNAHKSGILDTDFGNIPVKTDRELLIAVSHVLVEFGETNVRGEAVEYISSGEVANEVMNSGRAKHLRERIRTSVLRSSTRGGPLPPSRRANHMLPACS